MLYLPIPLKTLFKLKKLLLSFLWSKKSILAELMWPNWSWWSIVNDAPSVLQSTSHPFRSHIPSPRMGTGNPKTSGLQVHGYPALCCLIKYDSIFNLYKKMSLFDPQWGIYSGVYELKLFTFSTAQFLR